MTRYTALLRQESNTPLNNITRARAPKWKNRIKSERFEEYCVYDGTRRNNNNRTKYLFCSFFIDMIVLQSSPFHPYVYRSVWTRSSKRLIFHTEKCPLGHSWKFYTDCEVDRSFFCEIRSVHVNKNYQKFMEFYSPSFEC